VLYGVVGLLALLLGLLAAWQRRIDGRERTRLLAEITEAKSRGADRAVGQYPQIDPLLCLGCASCIRACPEDGVLGLANGVAHVIAKSKCIGHARCAEACPVGALTVGLGDVSSRTDLPRLTDDLETTVPRVYIAGELGGLALIRHAVTQGVQAVESIARREPPAGNGVADLLIVGAGPAGLAASLKATELGLSYLTIDQDDIGGTVRKYPRGKLVMTQPVELPLHGRLRKSEYRKEHLIDVWEEIIHRHDVRVRTGVKFLGATHRDGVFSAETSEGPCRSRHIVLALGRRGTPRRLGVEGEEQEKVLYQLVDAANYTGLRILVVGGGDSAIEAATGLADQAGNEVTLAYRKDGFFRLKSRNEQRIREYAEQGRVRVLFSTQVARIGAGDVVLAGADGDRQLRNDFVFVFAGGEPPFPLLKKVGIRFWKEDA